MTAEHGKEEMMLQAEGIQTAQTDCQGVLQGRDGVEISLGWLVAS